MIPLLRKAFEKAERRVPTDETDLEQERLSKTTTLAMTHGGNDALTDRRDDEFFRGW